MSGNEIIQLALAPIHARLQRIETILKSIANSDTSKNEAMMRMIQAFSAMGNEFKGLNAAIGVEYKTKDTVLLLITKWLGHEPSSKEKDELNAFALQNFGKITDAKLRENWDNFGLAFPGPEKVE